MNEDIKKALQDIKDVLPLTDKQEKFIIAVLELVYAKGERNQIINSLKSL